MMKIKSFIKENYRLLLLLLISSLIIFNQQIFLGKPPFFGNDPSLQYHYFYEEWLRLIKDFIKAYLRKADVTRKTEITTAFFNVLE